MINQNSLFSFRTPMINVNFPENSEAIFKTWAERSEKGK